MENYHLGNNNRIAIASYNNKKNKKSLSRMLALIPIIFIPYIFFFQNHINAISPFFPFLFNYSFVSCPVKASDEWNISCVGIICDYFNIFDYRDLYIFCIGQQVRWSTLIQRREEKNYNLWIKISVVINHCYLNRHMHAIHIDFKCAKFLPVSKRQIQNATLATVGALDKSNRSPIHTKTIFN